jgi:hypothetical protein
MFATMSAHGSTSSISGHPGAIGDSACRDDRQSGSSPHGGHQCQRVDFLRVAERRTFGPLDDESFNARVFGATRCHAVDGVIHRDAGLRESLRIPRGVPAEVVTNRTPDAMTSSTMPSFPTQEGQWKIDRPRLVGQVSRMRRISARTVSNSRDDVSMTPSAPASATAETGLLRASTPWALAESATERRSGRRPDWPRTREKSTAHQRH